MTRPKKQHAADRYAAEQIARAVRFSAFYSAGRDGTVSIECTSAAEAIAAADRLTIERGRFGRRAIAYATTPEGVSFPLGVEGYRGRSGRAEAPKHGVPHQWSGRWKLYQTEPVAEPDSGPVPDPRQIPLGDMLAERSGPALSPLPPSPAGAPSARTATPPNREEFDMSKPIARKFNADRAALRAATRTGNPHTIQAVAGGYIVVPVAAATPAPSPKAAIDQAETTKGAPLNETEQRALARAVAAAPMGKTRYFSGTDGRVTVFRASDTMAYQSAIMSGGRIQFSQTPARFAAVGSFPVNDITKAEYARLVELKAERLRAAGRGARDAVPGSSWVDNTALAAAPAPAPKRHPNECGRCGVKFPSYVALGKHACTADTAGNAAPSKADPEAPKLARRRRPLATRPGEMPTPPDFTANTHKPYRKKLEALIALAAAGDAEGLAAFAINPTSTSPKAMIRYRDAAVAAIRARKA